MRFAKYHGIGNDFVLFADPGDRLRLTPDLVRALCDRRFGIGADGIIRVGPGDGRTDLFLDYVNSDGSLGEMCGNGIRCLALFALAEGLTAKTELDIGTRAGTRRVVVDGDSVCVDMGAPVFEPARIPVAWDAPHAFGVKLEVAERVVEAVCLSMGNPHAVLFVDDPQVAPVETLGPLIERHPMFPNGTNVEFVRVESPRRVAMRVWERGSGETLGCGTGACAAAVAARLARAVGPDVTVALPGGELEVHWDGSADAPRPLFMTGPATCVFTGEIDVTAHGGGN